MSGRVQKISILCILLVGIFRVSMKIHSLRVDDFSVHNKIVVYKMVWHAHNAGLEDPSTRTTTNKIPYSYHQSREKKFIFTHTHTLTLTQIDKMIADLDIYFIYHLLTIFCFTFIHVFFSLHFIN